ncbi:MAG TPA: galactokinase family protein [Miltoncostaea sp.]|nr:galactokinase family protein [Miltoncostaea sp.]
MAVQPPQRVVAHAPGRATVLGDHTDHQRGLVLPFALARGVTVTAVRTGARTVEVLALDVAAEDRFPLDELPSAPPGDWRAYVRGVLAEMERHAGPLPGMRLTVTGDLPIGAGLSSSAALSSAVALAALAVAGAEEMERFLLAAVLRRVEWEWAGVRTGLMDQLAVLVSREGHALLADMATLDTRDVAMDGARFGGRDTGRRSVADGRYRERLDECAEAARRLGLPDLHAAVPADADRLPEPLAGRVRHVVSESARVRAGAVALEEGDLLGLGALMDESHRSLRDDFAVSTPAADAAWEAAHRAGALGARIMGAGFGGTVIALWDGPPPWGWIPLDPGRPAWAEVVR